jgi:hypothetical protein
VCLDHIVLYCASLSSQYLTRNNELMVQKMPLAVTFRYFQIDVSVRMYNRNAKMWKCNNAKMLQCEKAKILQFGKTKMLYYVASLWFCIFVFWIRKAKIRQMECKYRTDFMWRTFALLLSYFRFMQPKMRKSENTKRRQSPTCSSFRIFFFFFLHFRILRRRRPKYIVDYMIDVTEI